MFNINEQPVEVTDHCVVRYLERAMGLNLDLVRDHIRSICQGAASFGATSVRAEGLRFEIANHRVVTVTPDGIAPSRTTRERVQAKIARERHGDSI